MKILKRERVKAIVLAPGDSIILTHNDGESRTEVLRQTLDEHHTFDEAAVFALEAHELDELGLTDGLGGWFGKRKTRPRAR